MSCAPSSRTLNRVLPRWQISLQEGRRQRSWQRKMLDKNVLQIWWGLHQVLRLATIKSLSYTLRYLWSRRIELYGCFTGPDTSTNDTILCMSPIWGTTLKNHDSIMKSQVWENLPSCIGLTFFLPILSFLSTIVGSPELLIRTATELPNTNVHAVRIIPFHITPYLNSFLPLVLCWALPS